MRKGLLAKLREKKAIKAGMVAFGRIQRYCQMCGNGIRKVKVQTKLNFIRAVKNNRKRFFRYIG